jgi:hypothetical protein
MPQSILPGATLAGGGRRRNLHNNFFYLLQNTHYSIFKKHPTDEYNQS